MEPIHAGGVAVTQFHTAGTHICDERTRYGTSIAVGIEDLRTDMDTILVVTFIFIQCEILVDILHIGSCLITGIIRFRAVVGIR